jgi:hypothetical protein
MARDASSRFASATTAFQCSSGRGEANSARPRAKLRSLQAIARLSRGRRLIMKVISSRSRSSVFAMAGCLGPEQCAQQLQTCRSECRARIFAVDPRREVCLKGCSEVGPRCAQTADPPAQPRPKLRSRPRPIGINGQGWTPDREGRGGALWRQGRVTDCRLGVDGRDAGRARLPRMC